MFRNLSQLCRYRNFSILSVKNNLNKVKDATPGTPTPSSSTDVNFSDLSTVIPKNWEKKVLVFTGKYKSKDEIPSRVPVQTLANAISRARIKISNYLIVSVLVICFIASWWGKQKAHRGENISKRVLEEKEQYKLKHSMTAPSEKS